MRKDCEFPRGTYLRLVTKMLADIITKLAAHDAKLPALAPHLAIASDKESDVAEDSSQPRKGPTRGKLHIANNAMVHEVIWLMM